MSAPAAVKTLAIRLLESRQIAHTVYTYDADRFPGAGEVAAAIGLPASQVFKTLVTLPDQGKPILAVVPADSELDLKALAAAAGVKKVRMAPQAEAERMTGLQKGGISALALLNKGFVVYLDRSALAHERIAMSAGERGIQVALAPGDFIRLTNARLAAIAARS
jgi:Cys-tRNA(Pro)/Cys-tRNA(Cys) deacylase